MLLPKIILETLTDSELFLEDQSLNHVFVFFSETQKEDVRKFFVEQYTSLRIKEINELLGDYDSVSLYGCEYDFGFENSAVVLSEDWLDTYDEEETEDLIEIDGYYWSFDPHKIENYGTTITEIENGFLIEYDVPAYRDDCGENILGYSDAMKETLEELAKKYLDIKYYGYEGYYSSDTSDGGCSQNEFCSSPEEIPQTDSIIGKNVSSLNWNNVIISISECEDLDEETAKELTEFVEKYKDYIGVSKSTKTI